MIFARGLMILLLLIFLGIGGCIVYYIIKEEFRNDGKGDD